MTDLSTVHHSAWLEVHSGLGISIIDHLWNRLDGAYPNKWRAAFSGEQAIANWREAWSEAFDDERITLQEVASGIKACRTKFAWPPSLQEFLGLCRPAPDFESLFYSAANAAGTGNWKGNRLAFWAAQSVGAFEVRSEPYYRLESRWKKAVNELLADGELPEIPPRQQALPAPGQQSISRKEAAIRTAEIGAKIGRGDPKAWERKIMEHPENFPAISLQFAEKAMAAAA